MNFRSLIRPRVNFKKKSTVAFIAFWVLMFVLGMIVYNYGSGNKFGFDIFAGENRQTVGVGSSHNYNYSHSTEDIYDIDIRWQSGNIELKIGDSDEFRITETSAEELDHSKRLTIDGEDGSLLIKWDEHTGIMETLRGTYDKNLLVEIPDDFDIDVLKISSVYGEINVSGIEGSELKLTSTSANMKLQNCKANYMKLKTDSGTIDIGDIMAEEMKIVSTSGDIKAEDSVAHSLELDSVTGNIAFDGSFEKLTAASTEGQLNLSTKALPLQVELGSVFGNIELIIPEDSWLPVMLKSMSGEIETAFEELGIGNFPETEVDEDADEEEEEKYLDISTTSGSIKLIKGEKSQQLPEVFPEETEDD